MIGSSLSKARCICCRRAGLYPEFFGKAVPIILVRGDGRWAVASHVQPAHEEFDEAFAQWVFRGLVAQFGDESSVVTELQSGFREIFDDCQPTFCERVGPRLQR